MCEAERAWEESKIQQGITLGRSEGIELGKTQGIEQANRATYKTMLSKGFTIEEIANIFSVQVESVKEMIE